jgi:signal transduction histidine kinase
MKSSIAADIAAIQSIGAVPTILQAVIEMTGLRFACIARVTGDSWTTCAVLDKIGFGLKPGEQLDVATTLCSEVRDSRMPIVIDKASTDSHYCTHLTPQMYGFESYISFPLTRADGEYFGTLCALDPVPATLSNVKNITTLALFADLISLQLETEKKLDESRTALLDELETAELREQFVAVLGHDLRTPLASIIAGSDVLLARPLDKASISIVKRIQRSGLRISRLVDDVLDFTRGRIGGGIPLNLCEAKALNQDMLHVIAELKEGFPERVIECEMRIGESVFCDPGRVAQLLSNLVTNALVHGSVDTPVRVTASSLNRVFVLSVTNQGVPIPPDTVPRLFQPFSRGSVKGPEGGLGLGLYIASEIARSHGGSLDVVSSPEGTTFSFILPLGTSKTATGNTL